MKNIVKIIFVFIVLAICIWGISNYISSRQMKAEKKRAKIEKKIQIEKSVSEMIGKYNAVTDWKKNLNNENTLLAPIYTVQVEDVLIRNDGRPVLFFGFVEDVTRQGDKYYIYFQFYDFLDPDIRFILECDSEQAKKVMSQRVDRFEQYAVVVLISSLQRPKFEVKAYSQSDEYSEDEYSEVVVESSDIFIAKGHCLDLLFVGDYETREK